MAARETPEPWATWMRKAGITSLRELAEGSGVSPATITRLVHRDGDSHPATIEAVAEVLRVEEWQVSALSGREWGGFYIPPAEAAFLNPRLQQVLSELIRSLVEATRMNTDYVSVADEEPTPLHPIERVISEMDQHAKAARKTKRRRPDGDLG